MLDGTVVDLRCPIGAVHQLWTFDTRAAQQVSRRTVGFVKQSQQQVVGPNSMVSQSIGLEHGRLKKPVNDRTEFNVIGLRRHAVVQS